LVVCKKQSICFLCATMVNIPTASLTLFLPSHFKFFPLLFPSYFYLYLYFFKIFMFLCQILLKICNWNQSSCVLLRKNKKCQPNAPIFWFLSVIVLFSQKPFNQKQTNNSKFDNLKEQPSLRGHLSNFKASKS
jgi:hypothetical protein